MNELDDKGGIYLFRWFLPILIKQIPGTNNASFYLALFVAPFDDLIVRCCSARGTALKTWPNFLSFLMVLPSHREQKNASKILIIDEDMRLLK